ncbi:MAG: type II toxin-antitoxin system VapC family toxin [bacterium]
MICLLDTCTFIWLCTEPARLPNTVQRLIDANETELVLGDVSALEISLKWRSGKIALPEPPRGWVERQMGIWFIRSLPISREHIYRTSELPEHHRDPFDRLLVAAALVEGATILTPDTAIHRYPVSWRW